ncbi:MAG TPA: hypothetical protein VFT04_12635 [Gemmatimonadales bacterium]|nr:hypothetical protein [Gemmatimonadales bacterium]
MLRLLRSSVVILGSIAFAACGRGEPAGSAAARTDSAAPDSAAPGLISVIRVNEGQRGMIAMAKWLLPSDGNALLVVEDWSSIENEPFFDGMLFASESTGLVVRIDSIWDAAPSPDWSQVAFGAATIIRGGEQDQVPADSFRAAAARLGVSVDEARDASFPASGMAAMAGLAQVGIMDASTGRERRLPLLAGWRVRWSGDGQTLLAGRGPRRSDDDDPPSRWVSAEPATGAIVGPVEPDPALAPSWVAGPTIDMSVDPDTGRVEIPVEGGAVVSDSSRITLRGHRVGPGIALAATRRGCYIAALVPDSSAGEYDPKHRLMVYDTGCRR